VKGEKQKEKEGKKRANSHEEIGDEGEKGRDPDQGARA
jgi:hypothetical protein